MRIRTAIKIENKRELTDMQIKMVQKLESQILLFLKKLENFSLKKFGYLYFVCCIYFPERLYKDNL